jgi:hypothetical protein
MTAPEPEDLTPLERWAVDEGWMTLADVAAARKRHRVLVVGHDDPAAAGRDILDALRARGLRLG